MKDAFPSWRETLFLVTVIFCAFTGYRVGFSHGYERGHRDFVTGVGRVHEFSNRSFSEERRGVAPVGR